MAYNREGRVQLQLRIGERIRELRLERNRTQEDVAWALGIAKGHMSRIEAGENLPSLPLLFALAEELGVEAADIVGFELGRPRLKLLDAARRGDAGAAAAALKKVGLA